MNFKKIISFIAVCLAGMVISVCSIYSSDSSENSEEAIMMKDENLGPNVIIVSKTAIEHKKTAYVEEKVLKKLKEILAEDKDRNDRFYYLLGESCWSLGTKTLDFLEGLKIRDDEFMIIAAMQIIRDRLQLVAMLQDYLPKNELEAKIVNRIRFYSPNGERSYWFDDESRQYGSKMACPMLKSFKIGPLKNGRYVYVKCHGFEDEIFHKGEIDSFQASAAERECRKFGYSLGETYVISLENSDRSNGGFEK